MAGRFCVDESGILTLFVAIYTPILRRMGQRLNSCILLAKSPSKKTINTQFLICTGSL
jgi:hypothetical protein